MAEYIDVMRQWQRMCKSMQMKDMPCKEWCPLGRNQTCGELECASLDEINVAEAVILKWAKENPEPVYPSWLEAMGWGELQWCEVKAILARPMDSENAKKLGIEPKEE